MSEACQKLAFTYPIVVLKSGLKNNWMKKLGRVDRPLGWSQIDEHCWSNMTSQLIIQYVVGDGQTVQLAVFNNVRQCVLNNVEGVFQTDIHLLNNKSNA